MQRIDLPVEKKVGHLRLLRTPRSITPKEFNLLTFAERLEIVRSYRGKKKYDLLLEAADVQLLVESMPAQEIYLLLKEVGLESIEPLVPLISTEQYTSFLDLDCWQGDLFDSEKALAWLTLLLEAEEEKVVQVFREMDFEMLALLLRKFFTVVRGPEDIEDEDLRFEAVNRNGGYEVEYLDPEHSTLISALLDILFSNDKPAFLHLMEALRWENLSDLEENGYRSRCNRLMDQGFPDPFEALGIYAWLDPDSDVAGLRRARALGGAEIGIDPVGYCLTDARPADLLAEVLSDGLGQESAWELSCLINKVLIANRADLGDVQALKAVTEEVYRTLNLALEYLSGNDLEKAIALFEAVYIENLFRLGYSLGLHLQRRAASLRKTALIPYLDGPFKALLGALGRKKPAFYEGMENPDRGGERPFARLRDLTSASEWLDRLEVQQRLFAQHFPFTISAPEEMDLQGCYPEDTQDLALSDIFLTALANRVLGGEFAPEPVPESRIGELHGRICRDGKVDEELRKQTADWLETLEAGSGAFGNFCLDLWEEQFCATAVADLDPRYLGGLIVRGGR